MLNTHPSDRRAAACTCTKPVIAYRAWEYPEQTGWTRYVTIMLNPVFLARKENKPSCRIVGKAAWGSDVLTSRAICVLTKGRPKANTFAVNIV